ncbi:hypothetical protein BD324DRAFT_640266 [Kockovaella imperatae]|uniref:Low affinity iron permease-domain-containing protein n=1 Tax=Kockovaella imperatae TaxID=4999 RepID=A0A1Y1U5K5_9TREE|nr:hypothetical protein BD324DRAFT_640266 [Kockovaella imperatae]ORX33308.1 hypothetical protein BD324DRAFT_640266 [Kockovaella imperatae]
MFAALRATCTSVYLCEYHGKAEDEDKRVEPKRLDRWLDKVVSLAGSQTVFGLILAGLVGWALLGIKFSSSEKWPALISDIQAVLCYVFDSLLMRQQSNGYRWTMERVIRLKSRAASHQIMLERLELKVHPVDLELPQETRFGRFVTRCALVMGHIITIMLYWVAIGVWLGFGPKNSWSAQWLLDINSATSALMVLLFAFLANIRQRHAAYEEVCVKALEEMDEALDRRLREMTGYTDPSPEITILPPPTNVVQKIIYYYAEVVGALIGIASLIIVLIVWVAMGPVVKFSSGWWLFIGTYAGLVGMVDGFVLRNVQGQLQSHEEGQLGEIARMDRQMLARVGWEVAQERSPGRMARMSLAINRVCATQLMVVGGFITTLGLIIVSSVMRWNLVGQLLSNVPPSLIESFFMLILITGHNEAEARGRRALREMYEGRAVLSEGVKRLSDPKERSE